MKIGNIFTKIVLFGIIIFSNCFCIASRKDSACNIYNIQEKWCNTISKNYNEPFCITNFNNNDFDASDVNYAKTCLIPALVNKLSQPKFNKISTKDIIEQYCKTLLWESNNWRIYFSKPSSQTDSWDWQQTFDSHQSLFVYALCSSFNESWSTPFIDWKPTILQSFKWDIAELLKLNQKSDWKDSCSLNQDYWLSNCDMSIYVSKIYAWIMSDLFKIKYAQIFHVNKSENFEAEKEKKALDFINGYYQIDYKKYEDFENEYPKTATILASNQKYYKDVLDSLKIIDNSNLADIAKESECPTTWNMTGINFISCALHSSQGEKISLSPSFLTLLYNEILHYRLFFSYYENLAKSTQESDTKILESKISDFKQYFNIQMEATKQTQHDFEDLSMTYPLHIRILLNTEKAENFRNTSLSKIITSFYSLSEKLQNVQIPNS